jgi:hypothetical protein
MMSPELGIPNPGPSGADGLFTKPSKHDFPVKHEAAEAEFDIPVQKRPYF